MDGQQFDRWTRLIADGARSRRGIMRLIIGAGLATGTAGAMTETALACRDDGKRCQRDGQCCSGTCKRSRSSEGRCKKAPGAAGCTVKDDDCGRDDGDDPIPCPRRRDGFCVVLDNGRPFCARTGNCDECESDQDCTRLGGGVPGKCITNCRPCRADSNGRACVYARVLRDVE